MSKCDPKKDYEFNNECYSSCPDGTELDKSVMNKNICICKKLYYLKGENHVCINNNICPNEYPYLKIGTSECSNYKVIYKGEYLLECPEDTCITQININLATCVDKLDDTQILSGLCFDDFLLILDEIDNANSTNIVINENPVASINIYNNGIDLVEVKEKNKNLTYIYLDECTDKLKEYYNLRKEQQFYIISVDSLTKWSNKSTHDFYFNLYLDNGTQIEDLSPCYNSPIYISSSIIKLDLVNFEYAEIFEEQGYDIYNLTSDFYNDKCTSANIKGNDIIIKDRIKDIYPYNVSFCPNDCYLYKTEIKTKRFNCSCNISFIIDNLPSKNKKESELNIQANVSYLYFLLDKLNYKVFLCPRIIKKSTYKDYLNNIGFLIGTTITIFNIVCFFLLYYYFLFEIREEAYKSIKKNMTLFKKPINKNKIKNTNIGDNINNSKSNNNNNSSNDSKKEEMVLNRDNLNIIKYRKRKRLQTLNSESKNNQIQLDFANNLNNQNISSKNIGHYNIKKKLINNENDNEEKDYNSMPYTMALRLDHRRIFVIYLSLIKMKIDLLNILLYPEEYTHRSLLLSIYSLDFMFNYFMNALLYSDDVVSQKYHNNGTLEFATSLLLSFISIIISSIIIWIIKKLTNYNEYLKVIVKSITNEKSFNYIFNKVYKCIKVKVLSFYCLNFILCVISTYYLLIFGIIYKKSQISLLSNYLLGIIESLLESFGITLIVCVMRFFSLKCQLKQLYRTSVYLNNLL